MQAHRASIGPLNRGSAAWMLVGVIVGWCAAYRWWVE
jgi:hypothetical protein